LNGLVLARRFGNSRGETLAACAPGAIKIVGVSPHWARIVGVSPHWNRVVGGQPAFERMAMNRI
jgi:hypothetical protein